MVLFNSMFHMYSIRNGYLMVMTRNVHFGCTEEIAYYAATAAVEASERSTFSQNAFFVTTTAQLYKVHKNF